VRDSATGSPGSRDIKKDDDDNKGRNVGIIVGVFVGIFVLASCCICGAVIAWRYSRSQVHEAGRGYQQDQQDRQDLVINMANEGGPARLQRASDHRVWAQPASPDAADARQPDVLPGAIEEAANGVTREQSRLQVMQ